MRFPTGTVAYNNHWLNNKLGRTTGAQTKGVSNTHPMSAEAYVKVPLNVPTTHTLSCVYTCIEFVEITCSRLLPFSVNKNNGRLASGSATYDAVFTYLETPSCDI